MMGTMHRPRLLPATIVAMALLLLLKSVSLVWAATGAATGAEAGAPTGAEAGAPTGAETGPAQGAPPGGGAPVAAGTGPAPMAEPAPAPPARPVPAQDLAAPVSDAERALLLDLRHRREALDARGRALDQRSAVLAAAENRLTARVDELGVLQTKLEQLEADRRSHDDANWSGLVHVYETMKPREAAAIFDALDMQVLLAVLDRMQPRRAAPVLAAMQPDRARLATQMLAELRTRAITPAAITPAGTIPAANSPDSATPPKG